MVGSGVGATAGTTEGDTEGGFDGGVVGDSLGASEGCSVGDSEGSREGSIVVPVSPTVGLNDSVESEGCVGALLVGLRVGLMEGSTEGRLFLFPVGATLGIMVGETVGFTVSTIRLLKFVYTISPVLTLFGLLINNTSDSPS